MLKVSKQRVWETTWEVKIDTEACYVCYRGLSKIYCVQCSVKLARLRGGRVMWVTEGAWAWVRLIVCRALVTPLTLFLTWKEGRAHRQPGAHWPQYCKRNCLSSHNTPASYSESECPEKGVHSNSDQTAHSYRRSTQSVPPFMPWIWDVMFSKAWTPNIPMKFV